MVTKCVCSDVLFSEMKVTADKFNLRSIDQLKEYVNIGENCQFCIPYIEKMLKTGEAEFKPEFE